MKALYDRLTANGAIGPMMKVGPDGKEVYDPGGELAGQLVPRKHFEYPKAVRRVKKHEDGREEIITLVANSKSEELKILNDTAELEVERSPVERERDEIAQELATERKMNEKLATQLENALARIEKLAGAVEDLQKPKEAPKAAPAKGLGAMTVEQRALANKQ